MVNQTVRDRLITEFKNKLEEECGIKTSMDVVHAFVEGGDAPGFSKFVDALDEAGFDTSGGYEENKKFLNKLGISKSQWNEMALAEGFTVAEKTAKRLIDEACKTPKMEDEEKNEKHPCSKYMDPSRMEDFAEAIADMMKDGMSYGDAKAAAFDETEMPPAKSKCCMMIRELVDKKMKS